MREARDFNPRERTFRDDGCIVSPKCVDCPLPECVVEGGVPGHGGEEMWLKLKEINGKVRRMEEEDLGVREAAGVYGVSSRTIFRWLGKVRNARERGLICS